MVDFLTRHHVFRFCNVVLNDSTRLSAPTQNNSRANFVTVSLSPPRKKNNQEQESSLFDHLLRNFKCFFCLKFSPIFWILDFLKVDKSRKNFSFLDIDVSYPVFLVRHQSSKTEGRNSYATKKEGKTYCLIERIWATRGDCLLFLLKSPVFSWEKKWITLICVSPHFFKVRLTIVLREGRLNTSLSIGVYLIKEQ